MQGEPQNESLARVAHSGCDSLLVSHEKYCLDRHLESRALDLAKQTCGDPVVKAAYLSQGHTGVHHDSRHYRTARYVHHNNDAMKSLVYGKSKLLHARQHTAQNIAGPILREPQACEDEKHLHGRFQRKIEQM